MILYHRRARPHPAAPSPLTRLATALWLAATLAPAVHAQTLFTELEPNDNKATANAVALTAVGDTITGNSTGTSTTIPGAGSADYFRVSTPLQPTAIYRNNLTLTSNGGGGHTGTIRGLGQTATNPGNSGPGLPNPAARDTALQTSSAATGHRNQWYSFGAEASLYYRVTGAATTTADYTASFAQTVVTPVQLGSGFAAGSITLTNTGLGSTQDTEVHVYGADLKPIDGYQNDDVLDGTPVPPGSGSLNSRLTRHFDPGVYHLAISNFNIATHQLSPADEGTATASYLDFEGVMVNSSPTALASIPFRLTDANGSLDFTASKTEAFDVYWATITVVPEPGTGALLLVGGGGLAAVVAARRRRAPRRDRSD